MKIQSHWGQNLWKFSLRRHGACMLQIRWNTYLSLTFTDVGTFVLRFFLKTLLCLVSLTEYHDTSSPRDTSAVALLIGHLRFLLEILLSLKMLISSYFETLLSWDASSLRLIRRCFYLEMHLSWRYFYLAFHGDTSIEFSFKMLLSWDAYVLNFMETLLSWRRFYHEMLLAWFFYLEMLLSEFYVDTSILNMLLSSFILRRFCRVLFWDVSIEFHSETLLSSFILRRFWLDSSIWRCFYLNFT